MNQFQLSDVLSSKVYLNDRSNITFGSPRQYIEPFLEKFSKIGLPTTSDIFRVSVSERIANKEEESEVINAAYGRVLVEAKLPREFSAVDHDSVIGMVYALDTAKPSIRVYSGQNAWACTNLSIFGARYIHEVPIMSGVGSVYEKSLEFIDGITEQLARFQTIYQAMNDRLYDGEQIDRLIGYILREANKNKLIGTTPVLSAVRDLDDPKSKYGIKDGKTTQWNVYNALTQYVTDKVDIYEKSNKTMMICNLFVKELQ